MPQLEKSCSNTADNNASAPSYQPAIIDLALPAGYPVLPRGIDENNWNSFEDFVILVLSGSKTLNRGKSPHNRTEDDAKRILES